MEKLFKCVSHPSSGSKALDPREREENVMQSLRCFNLCIYEDELTIRESHPITEQARKNSRIMALYCHSPSVALGSVAREKPRSVIITSGTLAPMDPFIKDLCLRFHRIKELPHITDKVNIQVVGSFEGTPLNFEYSQRDRVQNIAAVGEIVARLVESVEGGVLIFFSCYSLIYKYV